MGTLEDTFTKEFEAVYYKEGGIKDEIMTISQESGQRTVNVYKLYKGEDQYTHYAIPEPQFRQHIADSTRQLSLMMHIGGGAISGALGGLGGGFIAKKFFKAEKAHYGKTALIGVGIGALVGLVNHFWHGKSTVNEAWDATVQEAQKSTPPAKDQIKHEPTRGLKELLTDFESNMNKAKSGGFAEKEAARKELQTETAAAR